MKKLLILFVSLISLLTNGLAQNVPQGFNYQAVARAKDGTVLINKELYLRISLFAVGQTVPQYQEKTKVKTNAYGLFNHVVGTGSPTIVASLANVTWGVGTAITIEASELDDNNYQPIVENMKIYSVPYALYAGNVASSNSSDHDTSATNELQSLNLDSHLLTLSGDTGSVDLSLYLNAPELDADPTNELIQSMSYTNDTLYIKEAGITRKTKIMPSLLGSDQQQLSWNNPWLGLTSSDSVNLSNGLATEAELQNVRDSLGTHLTQDQDLSSNNEIQQLTMSGDTLKLSSGGSINLSSYANTPELDADPTNELIQSMSYTNDTLYIKEAGITRKTKIMPSLLGSDQQQLSWNNPWLGLTSSDSVNLSNGLATEAELQNVQTQVSTINASLSSLQNHVSNDMDTSTTNEKISSVEVTNNRITVIENGITYTDTFKTSVAATAPITSSITGIGLNYGSGLTVPALGLNANKLTIFTDNSLQITGNNSLGVRIGNGLSSSTDGVVLGGILNSDVEFTLVTGKFFKILNQNSTSLISAQTNNLQIGSGVSDALVIKSLTAIHSFPSNPTPSPLDMLLIRRDGGLIDTIGINTLNPVQARNGLTTTGDTVKLGGALNQTTLIDIGNYTLDFKLAGSASSVFRVKNLNDVDILKIEPSHTIFKLTGTGTDFVVHGGLSQNALYINNDGKVGVGTNTPTSKLHVSGDLKVDNLGILHVDNKVGIGIPNPTEKLEVNGNMKVFANALIGQGSGNYLEVVGQTKMHHFPDATTNLTADRVLLWRASTQMVDTASLALFTPQAQNGLTATGSVVKLGGALNQATLIDIGNNTLDFKLGPIATSCFFSVKDYTQANLFKVDQNHTIFNIPAATGSDFVVHGGLSQNALYINNDGKVGIGTNNPTEKLEVFGNMKVAANAVIGQGSSSYLEVLGKTKMHHFPDSTTNLTADRVLLWRASTKQVDTAGLGVFTPQARNGLTLTGNVVKLGGSLTSPLTEIDLNNNTLLFKNDDANSVFEINNGVNAVFKALNNGNIGINESTPQAKLHVNGNVLIGTPTLNTSYILQVAGTSQLSNTLVQGVAQVTQQLLVGTGTGGATQQLYVAGDAAIADSLTIGEGGNTDLLRVNAQTRLDLFPSNVLTSEDKMLFWDYTTHKVSTMNFTELAGQLGTAPPPACPSGMTLIPNQNTCITTGDATTGSSNYYTSNIDCRQQGQRLCHADELLYVMSNPSGVVFVDTTSYWSSEFSNSSNAIAVKYQSAAQDIVVLYDPFVTTLANGKCCYDLR